MNVKTLVKIKKEGYEFFKKDLQEKGATCLSIGSSFYEEGILEDIVKACEETLIRAITFSDANLGDAVIFLSALQKSKAAIQAVGFTKTYMSVPDFSRIVEMLPSQINEIDFSENTVTYVSDVNEVEKAATLLGQQLAKKALQFIHFEDTQLSFNGKGLLSLIKALRENKALSMINLNGAVQSQEFAVEIVNLLSSSQSPSIELRLAKNKLGPDCASTLGQKINRATSLRSIDLSENNLGASAVTLIKALDRKAAIDINLSGNQIGKIKGNEVVLMKRVANRPCITRLDLRHNQIDWQGQSISSWMVAKSKAFVRSVLRRKNENYENRNDAELFLHYAEQASVVIELDDSRELMRQVHKRDLLNSGSRAVMGIGMSIEARKEIYIDAITAGDIKEEEKKAKIMGGNGNLIPRSVGIAIKARNEKVKQAHEESIDTREEMDPVLILDTNNNSISISVKIATLKMEVQREMEKGKEEACKNDQVPALIFNLPHPSPPIEIPTPPLTPSPSEEALFIEPKSEEDLEKTPERTAEKEVIILSSPDSPGSSSRSHSHSSPSI